MDRLMRLVTPLTPKYSTVFRPSTVEKSFLLTSNFKLERLWRLPSSPLGRGLRRVLNSVGKLFSRRKSVPQTLVDESFLLAQGHQEAASDLLRPAIASACHHQQRQDQQCRAGRLGNHLQSTQNKLTTVIRQPRVHLMRVG